MRLEGPKLLDERLKWVEGLARRADGYRKTANGCIIGLKELVGGSNLDSFPGYMKDPLKIIIGFKDEATGAKFKDLLVEKNLRWEKLTPRCVEFLVTIGTFNDHIQKLEQVIQEGQQWLGKPDEGSLAADGFDFEIAKGQVAVSPRTAALGDGELVELGVSEGRVCAQMLVPYPPGIPVFLPGLIITRRMIDRVEQVVQKHSAHAVHGLFGSGGKHYVRVMRKADEEEARGGQSEDARRIALIHRLVDDLERPEGVGR